MKKIGELTLFRAFRSTNYTLYFIGRSVSQFGTWMQRTAVIWVVYSITHSALLLGITIFAEQFPSFLFSIFGGVAADRYDRYKVIKITQITSMAQAMLLAVLVFTGHTVVWAILLLSAILGIINAFDVPARQALVHEVVADPGDLPNALSLTIAMASLAQLLGPALSGIVLNAFGAAVCFLINAASFGGVIISLLLMKLPAHQPKTSNKKVITELAEGFSYLKKAPDIGLIILMLAAVSLLVLPYNTVLPVFAKVVFKGNAATFGYITSFIGVGAVIGTIFLASSKPGAPLKRILFLSTIVMGVGLIGFSQVKNFPAAMFFCGDNRFWFRCAIYGLQYLCSIPIVARNAGTCHQHFVNGHIWYAAARQRFGRRSIAAYWRACNGFVRGDYCAFDSFDLRKISDEEKDKCRLKSPQDLW